VKQKRRNVEITKACRSCLSEVIAKVCLSETMEANKNREVLFSQMGQREIVRRRQEVQILSEMDDISDRIACAALEDIEAAELVHFRILTEFDIDMT
jgi:flagella basal body P-ring formation protein FlgA